MKRLTTPENDLRSAQEVYRHGPRAGFFLGGKKPFRRNGDSFSFSDRFVRIYFLVFIILTVLGIVAVIKTR